ncbi:hypothetical protein FRB93_009936 [Tulasnella sp. JGI-2019a]|nr:hypothetical protein FRB93_009936 [Tulasnella sp. JGI-2019a]
MDVDIPKDNEGDTLACSEPHSMLITAHQKDRVFIAFALRFFQENPQRPLVLHTRKAEPSREAKAASDVQEDLEISKSNTAKGRDLGYSCTRLTPKLITIVEIIKRELPIALKRTSMETGGTRDVGKLHQYNEVLCLEDEEGQEPEVGEEGSESRLQMAVNGKNHLKIKRTPYMKITLCRSPVPAFEHGRATYQAPIQWKPNKAQKTREKKRAKKRAAVLEKDDEEMIPESPGGIQGTTATAAPVVGVQGVIGTVEL